MTTDPATLSAAVAEPASMAAAPRAPSRVRRLRWCVMGLRSFQNEQPDRKAGNLATEPPESTEGEGLISRCALWGLCG